MKGKTITLILCLALISLLWGCGAKDDMMPDMSETPSSGPTAPPKEDMGPVVTMGPDNANGETSIIGQ